MGLDSYLYKKSYVRSGDWYKPEARMEVEVKTGGKVDKTFISFFGLDDNNNDINYNQAYKYLIQWRGEKESKELTKSLLLQNPHHIDDFGGYDFFFEVTDIRNWELNDDEPNVVVKVKVDDLKMGTTAPANNHHWVGYAAFGYE